VISKIEKSQLTIDPKFFADFFELSLQEVERLASSVSHIDFSFLRFNSYDRDIELMKIISSIQDGQRRSGPERIGDWRVGWKEVRDRLIIDGSSPILDMLLPKDVRSASTLRIFGDLAFSNNSFFERDLLLLTKMCFITKFVRGNFGKVLEFGCGTGYNLVLLNSMMPGRYSFEGYDWAPESQDILADLARNLDIRGYSFNFFKADRRVKIVKEALIMTFAALEQVGDKWAHFLSLLLESKPKLVLHMEPWLEGYDENCFIDYLGIWCHAQRNYLTGYFPFLFELEKRGEIEILFHKRLGIGGRMHEATTFCAWRPRFKS